MIRTIKIAFIWLLVITSGYATASTSERQYVMTLQPRVIAVLSEGCLEPRSTGSYSLRIYTELDPAFPYDNFITGVIKFRDGGVESLKSHDIDGDGIIDVIVVVRSVGSGGYISADAYKYKEQALSLLVSVSELPMNTDPIQALKSAYPRVPNTLNPTDR